MNKGTIVRNSRSENETVALGKTLGTLLREGDVVALYGDLGAGKTRFVRGLAEGLGHDPGGVSSPTYVLAQESWAEGRPMLVHIDAYRMQDPDEMDTLGYDLGATGGAVVAIEWAERLEKLLPPNHLRVSIEVEGPGARRIVLVWDGDGEDGGGGGDWRERLAPLASGV